jgi:hypothetical protein
MIFKVTQNGEASVFATYDGWKGEGFNLNGIAFHKNGYLLVDQSSTGNIYKISVKNPTEISRVNVKPIPGADGMILGKENELIVISNSSQKAYKLITKDSWSTAEITEEKTTSMPFPTTGVRVNGKYYIMNAKLNELFDPRATKTSDYLLEQIHFSDKK